jgi:hypothetical protein
MLRESDDCDAILKWNDRFNDALSIARAALEGDKP